MSTKQQKRLESEIEDQDDEEPSNIWDTCNRECPNCVFVPCDLVLSQWGTLQRVLDKMDDINEKVYFLQNVVSRNESVCFDTKCPIFSQISDLRITIADLDLQFTNIHDINASGRSPRDKDLYRNAYNRAKVACDFALQEILRVVTVNRSKSDFYKRRHAQRLELIDRLNESNFPVPFNVRADIEDGLSAENDDDQWEEFIKFKNEKIRSSLKNPAKKPTKKAKRE